MGFGGPQGGLGGLGEGGIPVELGSPGGGCCGKSGRDVRGPRGSLGVPRGCLGGPGLSRVAKGGSWRGFRRSWGRFEESPRGDWGSWGSSGVSRFQGSPWGALGDSGRVLGAGRGLGWGDGGKLGGLGGMLGPSPNRGDPKRQVRFPPQRCRHRWGPSTPHPGMGPTGSGGCLGWKGFFWGFLGGVCYGPGRRGVVLGEVNGV